MTLLNGIQPILYVAQLILVITPVLILPWTNQKVGTHLKQQWHKLATTSHIIVFAKCNKLFASSTTQCARPHRFVSLSVHSYSQDEKTQHWLQKKEAGGRGRTFALPLTLKFCCTSFQKLVNTEVRRQLSYTLCRLACWLLKFTLPNLYLSLSLHILARANFHCHPSKNHKVRLLIVNE